MKSIPFSIFKAILFFSWSIDVVLPGILLEVIMLKFVKDNVIIFILNVALTLLICFIYTSGFKVIVYKQMTGLSSLSADMERADPDYDHILRSFDSFQYWKLDLKEKTELLQEYANHLADELGIERRQVVVENLWNDSICARYDHATETITINARYLDLPEDVADSVAHEIYHAYQYSWVQLNECIKKDGLELFSIKDREQLKLAESWEPEFRNYINAALGKSFEEYEDQLIEISAREYAAEKLSEMKGDIQKLRQLTWGTKLFNEPMEKIITAKTQL